MGNFENNIFSEQNFTLYKRPGQGCKSQDGCYNL